jgi:Spy/CpxP family protein refolding chaperone
MRKKLALFVFALAATAAASVPHRARSSSSSGIWRSDGYGPAGTRVK